MVLTSVDLEEDRKDGGAEGEGGGGDGGIGPMMMNQREVSGTCTCILLCSAALCTSTCT